MATVLATVMATVMARVTAVAGMFGKNRMTLL
jgi:hypothetical protein